MSKKISSTFQKKYSRTVFVAGFLAIITVAVMPLLGEVGMASEKGASTLGQWIGFMGEFHPLFLHLPIGAVILVLVMEAASIFSRGKYKAQTTLALFFASAMAVFAAVFGYCLYLTGDFSGELIEEHKRDGILFTIFLISTFLMKYAYDTGYLQKLTKPIYFLGLIITTASMIGAGHHGGEITHGDPMDKAPWKLKEKPIKATTEQQEDLIVFTSIIQPILADKCVSCHGPKKQKSDLRMDSYAALIKGGEYVSCLVPGDVEKSMMIAYLHLPLDDELRMPPEGKPQMTDEEIKLLEWWVKTGASETATISELEAPTEITEALKAVN
ncbi:MAG: c-type cytochrome domain-containing protein [Akkermansiaceae bacterium]